MQKNWILERTRRERRELRRELRPVYLRYQEVIQQTDNSELLKAKEQAIAYNNAITPGAAAEDSYSQEALKAASQDYDSLLNITGEGTMGYVEIPKISVNLPIYHGTGNDSLDRGVGHLLGSSLIELVIHFLLVEITFYQTIGGFHGCYC